MSDMSVQQAKQSTAKASAEVFDPLVDDALATLEFLVSYGGRMLDLKASLAAAQFVLEKKYGKTPDQSSGQEPKWMRIVRKAMTVDGVPIESMPGVADSLGGTVTTEQEEITFEFVYDQAS